MNVHHGRGDTDAYSWTAETIRCGPGEGINYLLIMNSLSLIIQHAIKHAHFFTRSKMCMKLDYMYNNTSLLLLITIPYVD